MVSFYKSPILDFEPNGLNNSLFVQKPTASLAWLISGLSYNSCNYLNKNIPKHTKPSASIDSILTVHLVPVEIFLFTNAATLLESVSLLIT